MRVRYENWVNGLNGDWLVSRQRFFGVSFPIWYPLDADGSPIHDQPITADESALPVDPATDTPAGYTEAQLKLFNDRERTNDNAVMHAIVSKMTALEMAAVAEYLSGK